MSALHLSDALPRRPRRAIVLVAEDHEDTRQLLRTLLERRGLSVVEASDGLAAVDVAERERPDLILMDGGLPLLDGIAVTRRLRGQPALSAVPIVFLSGHAGPQSQRAALDAGCDEYVVKPFDIAHLDTVLNRHLPGDGAATKRRFLTDAMTQTETRASIRGGAEGVSRDGSTLRQLYGLIELDAAGTVLYTRFEANSAARDCMGLNFYTEVAPFRNVVEFRQMLDNFSRGSQPAHSTDFTCDYEDGPVHVRVLLARIRERSQADSTGSVLVHIRRAE
jgi:two-component system cell cycle response regulator DivK